MILTEQKYKKRARKMPAPGLEHRGTGLKQIVALYRNNRGRGVNLALGLYPPEPRANRQGRCRFPICPLHGTTVATDFPQACPWGARDAALALVQLRNEAWSATDRFASGGDPYDGVLLQNVFDTCSDCPIRTAPHFQWLRRRVHSAVSK